VVYYWLAPKSAYHLSYEVEDHAAHTYEKYLKDHPDDVRIEEIMNDEINHREELLNAMKIIKT